MTRGPSAVRYPRGEGSGLALPARGTPVPIGRGRVVREGAKGGGPAEVAILSLGATAGGRAGGSRRAGGARAQLTTVADARFAKPLDTHLAGAAGP